MSKFAFDDENTVEEEKVKVPKKTNINYQGNSKTKNKIIIIIVLAALIVCVGVGYFLFASSDDEPVYGDRCASLIAVDETKFDSIETTMEKSSNIEDVEIELNCRLFKVSITFKDGISKSTAKKLTKKTLKEMDSVLGGDEVNGSSYSTLFNTANGRGQYNVNFILYSENSEAFPAFGTKHPESDSISYTWATVKDKDTNAKVLEKAEEKAKAQAEESN